MKFNKTLLSAVCGCVLGFLHQLMLALLLLTVQLQWKGNGYSD